MVTRVKFPWGGVPPGIIPRSMPRLRVSDEYKSSLSPFPFDHPLQRFLRVFFRAGKDETRSLLLGLASGNVQDLLQVFLSHRNDSSFAVYHFASQLSSTFA